MEMLLLPAEECRPLRTALGRTTKYAGDDDPAAMHIAFKQGDELLVVGSILPERRDKRHEMWRLRGLVVAEEHRGKGLGKRLMTAVQMVVGERGGGLWCRAPAAAQGFLERCGMAVCGASEAQGARKAGARVVMTWDG